MIRHALQSGRRSGFSLLELLATVTLMGIVAAVVVPRLGNPSQVTRTRTCHVHRGNIEVQAQLWFRDRGTWPARDLSDIGQDAGSFPDGLPRCPVDGSAYEFDSDSEQVIGHRHD